MEAPAARMEACSGTVSRRKEYRPMRFPAGMSATVLRYTMKQRMSGRKRFPSVLMLEPLYTCNLACLGCSIERHTGRLADRVTLEQCLKAVEDSQAPGVSICG